MKAILGDLCTKFPNFGRLCTYEHSQRMAVGRGACRNGRLAPLPCGRRRLEPRSYSPNPVGVTFVVAAFTRSTGGVLTDPSLPVDDVEAEVDATALGLGHTFAFFGRSANIGVVQPRVSGHFTGTLDGEDAEASRSGIGDTKVKFTDEPHRRARDRHGRVLAPQARDHAGREPHGFGTER